MKLVKLGEICNISSAGDKPTDFTETKTNEHVVPVIANGIEDDGIIGYTSKPKIDRSAVTVSARGNIGTAFYRNYPYYPVIRLISVYPKNDSEIDCRYIYYLLKNSPLKSIGSSVQAQLTVPIASDVYLFIEDDYKTQQSIAAFLSIIDDKISTNSKIIETSEKLMREIYDYWFVQFDFPDGNGRPYKSSGGKMSYSEVFKKDIPKDWLVKRITDLVDIKTGQQYAGFGGENGKYRFFSCSKDQQWCDEYAFDGKNLVISTHGDFRVEHIDGKFNAYTCNTILKPHDDALFGYLFLVIDNYLPYLKQGASGSVIKFVNNKDILNIPVLLPFNKVLLSQFNAIIEQIQALEIENRKLVSLRDWLLPMLMNGQIKVNG